MNQKKVFHATRKSHRAILRAVRADDIPTMRKELHSLYDPFNSPLTEVTTGPCKRAFVPVVDGLMLAQYKRLPATGAELLDNVHKTGATFGLDENDIREVSSAAAAARRGDVTVMNKHLDKAGFSDTGMCIPAAMNN